MKSVFPTVEEYLLLDVLSNSDNNVQKAAERLVKMGYVSKNILPICIYINTFQFPKGKLICSFFLLCTLSLNVHHLFLFQVKRDTPSKYLSNVCISESDPEKKSNAGSFTTSKLFSIKIMYMSKVIKTFSISLPHLLGANTLK